VAAPEAVNPPKDGGAPEAVNPPKAVAAPEAVNPPKAVSTDPSPAEPTSTDGTPNRTTANEATTDGDATPTAGPADPARAGSPEDGIAVAEATSQRTTGTAACTSPRMRIVQGPVEPGQPLFLMSEPAAVATKTDATAAPSAAQAEESVKSAGRGTDRPAAASASTGSTAERPVDRRDVARSGSAPPVPIAPAPAPPEPLPPVPALPPPPAPVSSGACGGTWTGASQNAAGSGLPSGMLSWSFTTPQLGPDGQLRADRAGCILAGRGDPAVSPD